MNKELTKLYELRLNKAVKTFNKKGFDTKIFQKSVEAVDFFFDAVSENDIIGYGDSKTLIQLGIIERLRETPQNFLDIRNPHNSPEKKLELQRKCFYSDIFITSCNAVSMDGSLVNIDLYANRVSAIPFGPEKVYLFVGSNKLCVSQEEAIFRARNYASVMNAIRFNRDTPCTKTGYCHNCLSKERLCGVLSVIESCPIDKRICLVFINEELGF